MQYTPCNHGSFARVKGLACRTKHLVRRFLETTPDKGKDTCGKILPVQQHQQLPCKSVKGRLDQMEFCKGIISALWLGQSHTTNQDSTDLTNTITLNSLKPSSDIPFTK